MSPMIVRASGWMGIAAMAFAGAMSFARAARAAEPEISGGTAAGACVLPDVLCVGSTGCRCTATLVHPRVAIYAAHCGAATSFRLGEGGAATGALLRATKAMVNPAWGKETNPN